MRLRSLVCCVLLGSVAGTCFASFDLLLMVDAGTGVVHRYDGDTGNYLGNFGNGDLVGSTGITINQSLGLAFVAGGTTAPGYTIYNYNTGTFIGRNDYVTGVKTLAVMGSTGLVMANNTPTVTRVGSFGISGTTSTWTSANPEILSHIGVDSTSDIVSYSTETGRMNRWGSTPSGTPESTVLDNSYIGTTGSAMNGTTMLSIRANGVAITKNTQSLSAANSEGTAPANPWTSSIDIQLGHAGYAFGLGRLSGQTRLQRYIRANGGTSTIYNPFGASRTLTNVSNITGLAVVVAPEPGGLLAMVGGFALISRRRKQK